MSTYKNKVSLNFYSLNLSARITRETSLAKPKISQLPSLEDYYDMEDACSFLEQLRAYQLADILGKYKLF